jgi:hypothetical protein
MQLHCGGHLGGRARLPDTILEEDHPMTIPSKFGSNWATGSRQDGFYVNSHRVLCKTKYSCAAILVRGRDHQTQFWKRTIQWLSYQSLVPTEQLVPDKKMFMWISHRVLCYTKFGCGSHLGRRTEPLDTFLEENHPMNISSKFCSYWATGFRQDDFYGNFP